MFYDDVPDELTMSTLVMRVQSPKSAAYQRASRLEQIQHSVEQMQTKLASTDVKLEQMIAMFKQVEMAKLKRQAVLEKLVEAVIEV